MFESTEHRIFLNFARSESGDGTLSADANGCEVMNQKAK